MRRVFCVLVLLAVAAITLPSTATAGGTGACYAFGDLAASSPFGESGLDAFCFNDLTEDDCDFFTFGKGEWDPNSRCEDLKVDWDGSCLTEVGDGLACLFLYAAGDPNFSELLCEEKGSGQWFDDSSACGIPTPTMPGFGTAALALLMLAGALVLLTMKGRATTA